MKHTFLTILLLLVTGLTLHAQDRVQKADTLAVDTLAADTLSPEQRFKGTFYNEEIGLNIHLDLEEETLIVPGMSFLGPVHGYMKFKATKCFCASPTIWGQTRKMCCSPPKKMVLSTTKRSMGTTCDGP